MSITKLTKRVRKRDGKSIYFYQRIPNSLLEADLCNDEIKIIGFMVWYMGRFDNDLVPLSQKFLLTVLGGSYNKIIKMLLDKGLIELHTVNGFSYSQDLGICKRYFLNKKLKAEVKSGSVSKSQCKQIRARFDNKDKKETPLTQQKEHLRVIEKNYRNITILDEWQDVLWSDPIERIEKEDNYLYDRSMAHAIGTSDIFLSEGTTGRIFHPIICMRGSMRQFLRYNGEKMVGIDVKACHPTMLAKFSNSVEEQQKWLGICYGELYERFVDEFTTRDQVKQAFQLAISYSYGKSELAEAILLYIQSEAPSIYQWLTAQWKTCEILGKANNTPQNILQNLESKIFIDGVFKKIMHKYVLIPLHDGFACLQKDAEAIIRHLDKEFQKELNFKMKITTKAL